MSIQAIPKLHVPFLNLQTFRGNSAVHKMIYKVLLMKIFFSYHFYFICTLKLQSFEFKKIKIFLYA